MGSRSCTYGSQIRRLAGVRLLLALGLGVLTALVASDASGVVCSALLTLLPALAISAVMLARPYLGERAIARIRRRCGGSGARPRGAATAWVVGARRRCEHRLACGGLLIASALAGRAPPAVLADAR
jgi:hypothetical protein